MNSEVLSLVGPNGSGKTTEDKTAFNPWVNVLCQCAICLGENFSCTISKCEQVEQVRVDLVLHNVERMPQGAHRLVKGSGRVERGDFRYISSIARLFSSGLLTIQLARIIILNTPQLCCGDAHETDLRLKHAISIDVRIAACKSLCL